MAVTLTEIEAALQALYSGKTLVTLDKGSVVVPVFVDAPDVEEYTEREYPCINVDFQDLLDEPNNWDTESEVKISENTSGFPFVSTMRRNSHWYRIVFTIHAWTLDAPADRNLLRWVESRKEPKDALQVGSEVYWMFRTNFNRLDETIKDRKVYHKIWTYEILADIDNDETDAEVKQVHTVAFTTGLVKTLTKGNETYPIDASNSHVIAKDAVFTPHRTIIFDDQNFTILEP